MYYIYTFQLYVIFEKLIFMVSGRVDVGLNQKNKLGKTVKEVKCKTLSKKVKSKKGLTPHFSNPNPKNLDEERS